MKTNKLFWLIAIIVAAVLIYMVFVFSKPQTLEAPLQSESQFIGPTGPPSVIGPTEPPPGMVQ